MWNSDAKSSQWSKFPAFKITHMKQPTAAVAAGKRHRQAIFLTPMPFKFRTLPPRCPRNHGDNYGNENQSGIWQVASLSLALSSLMPFETSSCSIAGSCSPSFSVAHPLVSHSETLIHETQSAIGESDSETAAAQRFLPFFFARDLLLGNFLPITLQAPLIIFRAVIIAPTSSHGSHSDKKRPLIY